ncbi:MAG: helix-turn-helix transcriptional regulator [Alphaproteobacteria bacterium]|nr:helix-turn-helix transcriptional regulator [Alphaproteobacteria bacterium]
MTIGRQVRAARGLLRWSSATLGEKAGLTRETINKIEDDAVQPREGTLKDIIRVFDENGVEFIENSGVRLKPNSIEEFSGRDGFHHFYDILYADLVTNGGLIYASGVDEKLFCQYYGDCSRSNKHIVRMNEMMRARGEQYCMNILVCENDSNYVADGYARYRWLSKEYFTPACFYVFNNYLALISFTAIPAPHVILIKSAAFADAYRQLFQKLWETAKIPPELAMEFS